MSNLIEDLQSYAKLMTPGVGQLLSDAATRIAELEAAQPPAGFPSWEDWLAAQGIEILAPGSNGGWSLIRFNDSDGPAEAYNDLSGAGPFPNYPAALAAAKKEAQNDE